MTFDRDTIRNLVDSAQNKNAWYEITNKKSGGKTIAEIRIYNEISMFGITAEDFVTELDNITADEIVCRINCRGGSVFDGIAIHNALVRNKATITTWVDSLAASAASFIVQAGDRRVMQRHAQMMIHNANGVAAGDADAMREMAAILDQQNEVIANIYADRAPKEDQNRAYFLDLMSKSKWITDREAVDIGLADEVASKGTSNTGPTGEAGSSPRGTASSPPPRGETSTIESTTESESKQVDWSTLFSMTPEELLL